MKCLFLYNPNSGKGAVAKKRKLVEKVLKTKYDSVEIYEAKSAEDLKEKALSCADKVDAVIFSGGDGTFHHVICALDGKDVTLGYLPSGTVNDVARSLGIPRSLKGALKVIEKGHVEALDCISTGKECAMYIAAAGAFTSATYHTSQKSKRAFGAMAYAFEAVRHNLVLDVFPLKATSGGKTIETDAVLILVMNGRSVAGFPINKSGSMKDGQIETVIIKQVKRPNFLRRIGALFSVASLFVFGCKIRKKDVLRLCGDSVSIETNQDVVWDLDGEEGPRGKIEMRVCPSKVRLFVPKNKKI